MTTINIYETGNGEESMILQENIKDEINELKELINELKVENKELKQLILDLKKGLGKKPKQVVKKNEDSQVKVSANEIKIKENKPKGRQILKDTDKFKILSASSKALYNNIVLKPDGVLEYGNKKSRRRFTLKYDIYDILYVKSFSESETFTMGDFRQIYENKDEWDRFDLFKLIYNIRNNKKLQKIITEAQKTLRKNMEFTKKNDILYINNTNTEIPIHQARDWCNVYVNSNKSRDEYLWELQDKHKHINKDYIAIIIYNHDNNDLLDILKKEKVNPFIENNPSKRRNMIMNGGMV